jgi:hypothetical protein
MEPIIKTLLLLTFFVMILKFAELLVFGKREFICKKCGKLKTYKEMDSFHFCNNCDHERS